VSKETDKPKTNHASKYSDEQKRAALELVVACGGNIAEAARKADLPYRVIHAWTRAENINPAIHEDYEKTMRAREQKRIEALHATKDEIYSLHALHLRADIAEFDGLIDAEGNLDLKGARDKGISRMVKKLRTVPTKNGTIREIEFYSSHDAAVELSNLLGMRVKKDENPARVEREQRREEHRRRLLEQYAPEEVEQILLRAEQLDSELKSQTIQ
jgi:transposase-like protein